MRVHAGKLEGFAGGVVECGADFPDELALPVGPGTVGEQNYGHLGIEVDPQGTPAEPKVPNGVRRKQLSSRGVRRRRVPAESAGTASRSLAFCKAVNRLRFKQTAFS